MIVYTYEAYTGLTSPLLCIKKRNPTFFYDSNRFLFDFVALFFTPHTHIRRETKKKTIYRNEHFMHVYQWIIGCKYINEEEEEEEKGERENSCKKGVLIFILPCRWKTQWTESERVWSALSMISNANQNRMIKAHSKLVLHTINVIGYQWSI